MWQKAIVRVVQIRTEIDKGIRFYLDDLPKRDLAAHQAVINGVGTREVSKQQTTWLEDTPNFGERVNDTLPQVMVNG